ncbi:MAG: CorA family divalent cation transporter, partial [Rudaea sp.]
LSGDPNHAQAGPDYLLYLIVDEIIDRIFPILDSNDEEIDQLEDETIERASPQTLQRIFHLKQSLINIRRSIGPMREVANALAGNRYSLIDPQTGIYFRDLYDHLARIYELIETERDLLGSALDTYLSVVSNRLNEVMKRLTLIATIFLPISFLAGVGGMNFQQFPFRSDVVFTFIIAAMVAVPAGMLIYFYREGWL